MDRKEFEQQNKEKKKELRKNFFKGSLVSIIIIGVCIILLSTASFAWFSATKSVSLASLTAPTYEITVSVTDEKKVSVASLENEPTSFEFDGGKTYYATITLTYAGKNESGYCKVVNKTTSADYGHTAQLAKDASVTIKIEVPTGTAKQKFSFVPQWGTSPENPLASLDPAKIVYTNEFVYYVGASGTAPAGVTLNSENILAGLQNMCNFISDPEKAKYDTYIVRMTSDLTLTGSVTITQSMTLDLNGHNLTINNDNSEGAGKKITIGAGKILRIVDSSTSKNGNVLYKKESTEEGAISWYDGEGTMDCQVTAKKQDQPKTSGSGSPNPETQPAEQEETTTAVPQPETTTKQEETSTAEPQSEETSSEQ